MKGKILLISGLAVGYVLGARAGRERYEQIKRSAARVWESPQVQRGVQQAEEFVRDTAPELTQRLVESTKKLTETLRGGADATKAPATGASSRSTAARSSGGTRSTSGSRSTASRSTASRSTASSTRSAGSRSSGGSTTRRTTRPSGDDES